MRSPFILTFLTSCFWLRSLLPVLSLPVPLQTELSDRNLETIDRLVDIAQH
jgi:hypothetical protein